MNTVDTLQYVVLEEPMAAQLFWRVRAVNSIGNGPWSAAYTFIIDFESGIENSFLSESGFELQQNFPNPFNPHTTIGFNLPERGLVQIRIYNILGKLISTLLDDHKNSGLHFVKWDGTNVRGVQAASGTYIYNMRVKTAAKQEITITKRMLKIQ